MHKIYFSQLNKVFTITLPLLFNVKMESVSMVSVCAHWQSVKQTFK